MHCRQVSRAKHQLLKDLEKQLRFISSLSSQNDNVFALQVQKLKAQISSLLDDKLHGARVRSRVQQLDKSEAPSSHFVKKELANARKRSISKLVNGEEVFITPQGIRSHCVEFYSSLYQEEEVDRSLVDDFLQDVPRLSEVDAGSCEGIITKSECWEAIKAMKLNKSPPVLSGRSPF